MPIPHESGTLVDGPDFFGSCLGCCLEQTGSAVITLTKLLYFKSNLASLAIHQPTQVLRWPLFLVSILTYLLKRQLLGLIPELGRWLPDCQELPAPVSQGVENSEDCHRLLQANPMSFHYPAPTRPYSRSSIPSAPHFPSCSVNPFRTAQLSEQRVNSEGS